MAFCSGGNQIVCGVAGYLSKDRMPRLNILMSKNKFGVAGYAIGGAYLWGSF
ncbi:MAG TPA: hypothetical protein PLJ21_04345 [Pseudobdellovibrionaceae bacterium]|nr:hypothetical protein [Pseudobdellovibrionaceae bacterium]